MTKEQMKGNTESFTQTKVLLETEKNMILANPKAFALLEQGNPRMAQIIRLKFVDGKTRKEIAAKLEIHVTRVAELEVAAINNLKRILRGENLSVSKPQIPEKPTSVSVTPEKYAELEKIPLDLFVCFRIKRPKGHEEIMVDFSTEFYRMGKGKMSHYILAYKKGLSGNLDEESRKELREAILEIRNLTGFSAENLLKKKKLLENEYNSGTIPQSTKDQLVWAKRG